MKTLVTIELERTKFGDKDSITLYENCGLYALTSGKPNFDNEDSLEDIINRLPRILARQENEIEKVTNILKSL